ncbi:HYCCIN 2 [Hibiscus trionum]|uniref:HYCCIN 2 n=1 Tax=Hibiscus trionum TaxID=183268 RepID=A0A9W7J0N4_HIBTR|nr:HYCCIN 2 [Hibiscus trionum]
MDFHRNPFTNSPSSSASSTSSSLAHHQPPPSTASINNDPMHSWWESVSKQRSRILSLAALLPSSGASVSSLADSDRPAVSLLSSPSACSLISSALSSPTSGSGSDLLCQWLYETFQSPDPHLRLLVLSFLPLLSGIYLSRIHSSDSSSLPSLAGFEAVLLAVYSSEAKSRAGKPLLVQIPDLSQPSLYHTPRTESVDDRSRQSVGVLSPPLEPHLAVKSTKRAIIVGTAFDCYYKQVSQIPAWSKLDFCKIAAAWAGQDCPCRTKFDSDDDDRRENGNGYYHVSGEDSGFSNRTRSRDGNEEDYEHDVIKEVVVEEMNNLGINGNVENLVIKGVRIPLPWELLRPVVTILGHCLFGPLNSQDVKAAASVTVRCLYARASHDLAPQAILALQSLIRLDRSARAAATAATNATSEANTPSKAKKPEILLVSK